MTEEDNYEKIVKNIEKLAGMLGVGLMEMTSKDLYQIQEYLKIQLGGWTAEKIVKIADAMSQGKNPAKEIKKLKEKAPPVNTNVNADHFSARTGLARRRLPKTNHPYSKWSVVNIFKGPRRKQ